MALKDDIQALDAKVTALTSSITAAPPVDDPEAVAAFAQLSTDFDALAAKLQTVGVVPATGG